jgi:Tol biopolymer transport system component
LVVTGSGLDFQVQSSSTGALVKDLGPVPGWTNNGLALSPDGQDVYVVVNETSSLAIERLSVANSSETFVANGEEPSISPDGHLLAFGTGPSGGQTLAVRDLASGKDQSIDLSRLLGGQTDLLTASIIWLGDGSKIVVLPGGVVYNGMGSGTPRPLPGSCSAVSASDTCLIVVSVRAGYPLTAKRVLLGGSLRDIPLIGASGSSDIVAIGFGGRRSNVYTADLTNGAKSFTRLFSLPSILPRGFGARGTELFYLAGHNPTALWRARITSDGLKDAKMLHADIGLSGFAG